MHSTHTVVASLYIRQTKVRILFILCIVYIQNGVCVSNFPYPVECQIYLKVHKHEIFFYFFCRNRNLMVPRTCKTRFLKIVFDSAELFDF
jgi:hypothetical protein